MKIVLWGTGYIYNQIKNSLAYYELSNQVDVLGVTMSMNPQKGMVDGYTIYTHEELQSLEFDYFVIMSEKYFEDIAATIKSLGFSEEKILSYKMFQIPNVNLKEYISLKENRLSILSNNCWGGVVYATLGIECFSPTKNLFLRDRDYIKFIKNIETYLEETPVYLRDDIDKNSLIKYPVLLLKDVEIHCNHSETATDAIRDWERRKKKINVDNIFVEMFTDKEEIAKEFLSISRFKNKLCLVPMELECKDAIQIDLNQGNLKQWEVILGTASLNNEIFRYDLIKLLHGKKVLRIK